MTLRTPIALATLAVGMLATPAGAQTPGAAPTATASGHRAVLDPTPAVTGEGGAAGANLGQGATGGSGAGEGKTSSPATGEAQHYSAFVLQASAQLAERAAAVHAGCAVTTDELRATIAGNVAKALAPDGKTAVVFDKVPQGALFPKDWPETKRKEVYGQLVKGPVLGALLKAEKDLTMANLPNEQPVRDYFEALLNEKARKAICERFGGPKATALDVTAFRDVTLANAAVVADYSSVKKVEEAIVKLATPLADAPEVARGADPLATVPKVRHAGEGAAAAMAAFGTEFAAMALSGLAKLVVERAKYETAMWALDQLGKSVCGSDEAAKDHPDLQLFHEEMSTYWTPGLCKHAKDGILWQYGTNTATLSALRADIEADVRRWPGSAVGLGVGAVLWEDAHSTCSWQTAKDEAAGCAPLRVTVRHVRESTAKHLTSMLDGTAPPLALSKLGAELVASNEIAGEGADKKRLLRSANIAVLACAATLPQEVAAKRKVIGGTASDAERTRAAVLGAATASNACFHLVGKGKVLDDTCLGGGACDSKNGLQDPEGKVERLTTIVRLDERVGGALRDVEAEAQVLQSAIEALPAAAKAAREAVDKWRDVKPPTIDASALAKGDSPEKILQSYLSGVQSAYEVAAVRDYLTALVTVAKASVGVSDAVVGGLLAASDLKELVPGLCDGAPSACGSTEKLQASLKVVRDELAQINAALMVMQRIAAYDWTNAVRDGLAAMREALDKAGGGGAPGATDARVQSIAKLGVFLSSVLAARDGDQMAAVLDSIADPPGGWRHKQILGAFTVSISSFPGLFAGAELRRGLYLVDERMNQTHGIAPALTLPVGVDFAWGFAGGTCGLFFPLLDPAGFLQYDADADARLPGASLKTALAFGVGARYAPKGTPINLMLMAPFFRPGFRQAEPDATGTGADAFQIGFALGIDVTLFEIASSVSR